MQAAILVIGDEILSGHTQDTNSHWLAGRLHHLGVPLAEIRAVGDQARFMQAAVYELQERRGGDFVIACGGLGPTHDDRTVAAMAALHGVPLVEDAATRAWLEGRYRRLHESGRRDRPEMDASVRKMMMVPRGAEVYQNETGAAPGLILRRRLLAREADAFTFILPGVPEELRSLWLQHLEPRLVQLAGTTLEPRFVREVLFRGYESRVADLLESVERAHDGVAIGSYPRWGRKEVILRVSGHAQPGVDACFKALLAALRDAGEEAEPLP